MAADPSTTQPEPRSLTEALDRLRERVFDAHGEADFVTVSVHDLLLALAATPDPAPAVTCVDCGGDHPSGHPWHTPPAPAVVPDVERLAEALYETDPPESWMRTGTDEYRKRAATMLAILAQREPASGEGRGALDVELLRAAGRVAEEYGKLRTEAGSPRLDTACADLALAVSHLAQREPAESHDE